MEETSSVEVGDLSSVVVVTVREGGDAHTLEVLLLKDTPQREKN